MISSKWYASRKLPGRWMKISALLCLSGADIALAEQPIDLPRFQKHIQAHHPAFEAERLALKASEARRESTRSAEDWVLSSAPFYRDEEPVGSSAFTPTEQQSFGADATVSRQVWRTGGDVSLSLNYDFVDQQVPLIEFPGTPVDQGFESSQPTFHRHRALISYLHPLLKNANGNQDRLTYDLQGIGVQIQRIQVVEKREELVLQLSRKFIESVLLREQLRISDGREVLSRDQLKDSRDRRAQNLIDEVDVLRAENTFQLARQRTLLASARFRAALVELRVLGGLAEEAVPSFDLYDTKAVPEVDEVLVEIFAQARVLRALDLDGTRIQRQLAGLDNQERSQLDLVMSGGMGGGGESYSDSTTLDKPELQLGLRFQVPWGNNGVKHQRAAEHFELEQRAEQREDLRRTLEAGIRNTIIQLNELLAILEINRKQIDAARRQTVEEQKAYDQGRSPLTFVIQSRDAEAQAEILLAENATQFQVMRLQLLALTDQLVVE